MNYILHLNHIFERFQEDHRITPHHIAMYMALFQLWNKLRFKNPINVNRHELMLQSKIGSKTTYHKCLKELSEWKYLSYKPSHDTHKGSIVYLYTFGTTAGQLLGQPNRPESSETHLAGTPVVPQSGHYNKHYKQTDINGSQFLNKKNYDEPL